MADERERKKNRFNPGMEPEVEAKNIIDAQEKTIAQTHEDPPSNPHATLPSVKEGESEKASSSVKSDSAANELGLLDNQLKMMILQFPPVLPVPLVAQAVSIRGKEQIGISASDAINKGSKLHELPSGRIGKLQVYKSGAVKLIIGENQFKVVPNPKTNLDQAVVAMNKGKNDFSVLETVIVNTKAVVNPLKE